MQVSVQPPRDILVADSDAAIERCLVSLRQDLRVTVAHTQQAALTSLARITPALVVTELDLEGGPGEEICRAAKRLRSPATVLVITAAAQRAPSALTAGCDGILLKPFAPNLLHARIGRLLRARSVELHLAAQRDLAKAAHSTQQATRWRTGTNASWPDTICPKCEHPGATGFDHASHRRDWYACLACGHVWIAKRQQP